MQAKITKPQAEAILTLGERRLDGKRHNQREDKSSVHLSQAIHAPEEHVYSGSPASVAAFRLRQR